MIRELLIRNRKIYAILSCFKGFVRDFPFWLVSRILSLCPVDNKKILIDYPDSREPQAILNALINENTYKLVLASKHKTIVSDCVKYVYPNSFNYVYELCTSKIWIDNGRKDNWVKRRPNQIYYQTWHSPVCIKKIEKDAIDTLTPYYVQKSKRDSKNISYIVAESKWRKNNIKSAFWYDGPILEGEFKDEILGKKIDSREVLSELSSQPFDHIILYVPTFRKMGNMDCYDIDFRRLIDVLNQRDASEKWGVIVRLHPNLIDSVKQIEFSNDIIDATSYYSISRLINISEYIITDYSSCLFHGFRAKKKVIMYASDIEDYLRNERGVYFDFYNLPSPLVKNTDELINSINEFKVDEYEKKRSSFVKEIGYYETDIVPVILGMINEQCSKEG